MMSTLYKSIIEDAIYDTFVLSSKFAKQTPLVNSLQNKLH